MDIRRLISYFVVAGLAVWLWNTWIKDYPPQTSKQKTTTEQNAAAKSSASSTNFTPPTFNTKQAAHQAKSKGVSQALNQPTSQDKLIHVTTDVFDIAISGTGGNIVSTKLLKYSVSLKQPNVFVQLLNPEPDKLYLSQNGLTNTNGSDKVSSIVYTPSQRSFKLAEGQQQLTVTLKGKTTNGLEVIKNYTFTRGSYAIKLNYQITNTSAKEWTGSLYTQLLRRKPEKTHSTFYVRSYNGAAISSPQTPYRKVSYGDMDDKNIDQTHAGGWVAFQQHYFLSAWIPANQKQVNHYYSQVREPPDGSHHIYLIGFVNPALTIAPGKSETASATLYVGPEIVKNLTPLAPGLDHTIDYGWLAPISIIIFWVMNKIHSLLGNWGWSIVITTILIKILFYWFSATSFRSMARMREMQPRLKALKERYADDRQAMSKATMELYRKEKINPLGGCLPMLIQIPVFIALYYVLIESVQLRQAPFIFWIKDLSAPDPYYILPILMGISMLVQQKLTPASPDPTQAKIMMVLPVVFTIFFINFPSGLVLYWLVNNVVQSLQQWYVIKTYDSHIAKKKARKARRKKSAKR